MTKKTTPIEYTRISLCKPEEQAERAIKIKEHYKVPELMQFMCSSYTAKYKLRRVIILSDMPNKEFAYAQAKQLFLNEPDLRPFYTEHPTIPGRSDRIILKEYKG